MRPFVVCVEVVIVAARITDKKRKKIVADYLELGSYRAVARKNGVSAATVSRIMQDCCDIEQKVAHKKEENTADILAYMEAQKNRVCEIIDISLEVLPDKIRNAKTAADVTTAMGTVISKWAEVKDSVDSDGVQVVIDV